jgi:hypothetical protein
MTDKPKLPPVVVDVPDDHVMTDDECDAVADALFDALLAQRDQK